MAILTAGSSITLTMSESSSVTVATRGYVTTTAVSGLGIAAGKIGEFTGTRTLGPYPAGSITLQAGGGRECYYEVSQSVRPAVSPLVLAQSAVANSLTGTVAETALASITIPGGLMRSNGSLRISASVTCTNNANSKTVFARLGGQQASVLNVSGGAAGTYSIIIANRNSPASQHHRNTGHFASTAAIGSLTVNTATDQVLTLSGVLGVATDTLTLESYMVELLPG